MKPTITINDGLAIYRLGEGSPVLLFPYPHATTVLPMGEDKLAALLAGLGYQVITFDPPGAYRSTRRMTCDMAEMLSCASEALHICRIQPPVRIAGHSMGGLCALGLAIQQPELVERLALVCTLSGFPAVMRWSTPHNWSPWKDPQWWQCMGLGARQMLGLGNLVVHKRLDNLVESASFVDPRHIQGWTIAPGDHQLPAPPRSRWLRTVRQVDYRRQLDKVRAPTWLCAARHDPQTPLPCSQELKAGIHQAQLVFFEQSGHSPFIEEPELFCQEIYRFLR
jgi:pimeloyl-ACP methyl ester carboxylesterase